MAVANLKLFTEYVEDKKLNDTHLSDSEMKYIEKICENVTVRIENIDKARGLIKKNAITIKSIADDGVASNATFSRKPILGDFIKYLGSKYNIKPYEVNFSNEPLNEKKDLLEDTQRRLRALVGVDEEKLDLQVQLESLESNYKRVLEENRSLKSRIKTLEKKNSNKSERDEDKNIFSINDYNKE